MTLTYFCDTDTHSQHRYSDVILHCSHTARKSVGGYMTYVILTFAKRVKMPGPTFWFSGSSMLVTWPRTFIFSKIADVREPLQSLLFGRHLPTFATEIQLYDRSKIWSIFRKLWRQPWKWLEIFVTFYVSVASAGSYCSFLISVEQIC